MRMQVYPGAGFWPETTEPLLRTTEVGAPSKWIAYQRPTRALLRQYRVPEADIEDLTVLALERLCRRVKQYDPQRGSFRSYYQAIVYHLFADYYQQRQRERNLRRQLSRQSREPEPPVDLPAEEGFELGGEVGLELLVERGRALFDEFIASQPPRRQERRDAETLWHWVVEGRTQPQLSARLKRSTRTVRYRLQKGIDGFAAWARERFHPDDFAVLERASRLLDESGGAKETPDVRQLFRYLSEEKRRVILAVLGRLSARADDEPEVRCRPPAQGS